VIRRALLFLMVLGAGVGTGVARAGDAPNLAVVVPPAARVSVDEAIRTAVEFLVKEQNADGSFSKYTSARTYELWCDVPGGHQAFKTATTALCWMGLQSSPYQTDASRAAQKRCLAWLVKHARVKRPFAEQFYNVWALGYGLRALAQALAVKAPGASEADLRTMMDRLVKALGIYQSPDGGWGYLDFNVPGYKPSWSTSFTTATVMIALHDARAVGIEVPERMIERGTKLMWRYRTPDGNYLYSIDWKWRPNGRINRPAGSSLRNQSCNLAIHLFDDKLGVPEMRTGLQQLVDNHRFAIAGMRRPIPHESWYAVSGYFYLYGQQYAACVLERMPEADQRIFWPKVVAFTLQARQLDGSFWDYPTYGYHKFYGTGYALMTLSRCPPAIAKTIQPPTGS